MATQKTWTMNDTQRAFVNEVVKAGKGGTTIFELKLQGKNFASGAVNTLVKKGVLVTKGEREFVCDVVFNGVKVGETTKTRVVFALPDEQYEDEGK